MSTTMYSHHHSTFLSSPSPFCPCTRANLLIFTLHKVYQWPGANKIVLWWKHFLFSKVICMPVLYLTAQASQPPSKSPASMLYKAAVEFVQNLAWSFHPLKLTHNKILPHILFQILYKYIHWLELCIAYPCWTTKQLNWTTFYMRTHIVSFITN